VTVLTPVKLPGGNPTGLGLIPHVGIRLGLILIRHLGILGLGFSNRNPWDSRIHANIFASAPRLSLIHFDH
jgi:hypothetical protein